MLSVTTATSFSRSELCVIEARGGKNTSSAAAAADAGGFYITYISSLAAKASDMPMPDTKHAVRSIGPIFPNSMNPRLWPTRAAANEPQGTRVFLVASIDTFVFGLVLKVALGGSARGTRAFATGYSQAIISIADAHDPTARGQYAWTGWAD